MVSHVQGTTTSAYSLPYKPMHASGCILVNRGKAPTLVYADEFYGGLYTATVAPRAWESTDEFMHRQIKAEVFK